MAAVSIANSPLTLSTMSGRRVPLQSNPNAANSPYRAVAAAAAKQKRSYATIQREETYGQPPPAKKQMVKVNQLGSRSPNRQALANAAEGRVFTRKSNVTQPSAFARKLEALRVKNVPQNQATADLKISDENLDTIRLWQRHYRKVFPKFVFYFESVSEESRAKFSKQVTALGARVEKFFSNAVTHVVTTRTIPREQDVSSGEPNNESSNNESLSSNPQTINPSLLDRSSEPSAFQYEARPTKSRFTFEAPAAGRKLVSNTQDVDVRRQQGRNADVLHRARALGMKIWASEKLDRMMITMFETDMSSQVTHGHNTRSIAVQNNATPIPRLHREADLSQLLRNERINGPSDRDPTVAMKEMVLFKGPFIYIHDIDEKQKPIMVREYSKVSQKEDGDWPQFRSVSNGRCPFIEEFDDDHRDVQREMERQQRLRERESSVVPTRAATGEAARMEPPRLSKNTNPLTNIENNASRRTATAPAKQPSLFEMVPPNMEAEHSSKGSQNAFTSRAGAGRTVGGEPVASGVQPSNITSAIRSQMISSTAAGPGAKAGTSKEVHGLQRKVLERNSGSATFGQTSSHRMTDFHNVVKEDSASKGSTRQKSKAKLDLIIEDMSNVEAPGARCTETGKKAKPVEKKKTEKPHGKLGYCENCMETFADFNEHASSRKHRKFAENNDNWHELDLLLRQLARPSREDMY